MKRDDVKPAGKDTNAHAQPSERTIAASRKLAEVVALKDGKAPLRETSSPSRMVAPFQRGDHAELADRLLVSLAADKSDIVHDDGAIHVYDAKRGIWIAPDDAELRAIVKSYAGAECLTARGETVRLTVQVSDAKGAIMFAGDVVHRPGFFARAAPGVAFANGFVCIDATGIRLLPHSREHCARYAYPFGYSDDRAPQWESFLAAAFRGDADAADKSACVEELAGAALLGIATRYQRAVVLVGSGANAKSATIAILTRSMPPGSTCAIAPQTWNNDYRRALLAGKRLNAVSELPEADILASEDFKAIISGDNTTARHIRQAPFTFAPEAAHLFAANTLPGTIDHTPAFWRRFIVIRYNRVFNDDEADEGIAEKIVTAERGAIVASLLRAGQRLMARGKFTIPASAAAELKDWQSRADALRLFIDEQMTPAATPQDWTTAERLYQAFRGWAEHNGHRPMASNKFGARMRLLGYTEAAGKWERTVHGAAYALAIRGVGAPSMPEEPHVDEAEERAAIRETDGIKLCPRCGLPSSDRDGALPPSPTTCHC